MPTVTNLDTPSYSGRGNIIESIASFDRPANATVYASGDVVSDDAVTARVLKFPQCGVAGLIQRVALSIETVADVAFDLFVFDAEPTPAADNAAIAIVQADIPKLVAVYTFLTGADRKISGAFTTWVPKLDAAATVDAPFTSNADDENSLYGLLVARSAWTPPNAGRVLVRLGICPR